MGGTSTKLCKHLEYGDEYAALKIIEKNHEEIVQNFDPNQPITECGNSALHLASKYAMKPLIRILIFEMNGNPNVKNHLHQNCLHLVCQMDSLTRNGISSDPIIETKRERRTQCASLIFQWKKDDETIDLCALDRSGNSPLHYASANGLINIVQLIKESSLFVENDNGDTACDLASKFGHSDVSRYLEMEMVFANEDLLAHQSLEENCFTSEEYLGLNANDLQEAKDRLILETADMLNVPLSTSEGLLRCFEWSRESLLDSWMSDSQSCFIKAGVSFPVLETEPNAEITSNDTTVSSNDTTVSSNDTTVSSNDTTVSSNDTTVSTFNDTTVSTSNDTIEEDRGEQNSFIGHNTKDTSACGICSLELTQCESIIKIQCDHQFCSLCFKIYVEQKIEDGIVQNIECPEYECSQLLSIDVISKIVSPKLSKKIINFDIDAFVESNPNIQWCPAPGCERAVYLPESHCKSPPIVLPNFAPLPPLSHSVDCGSGHYFCWECKRDAHAPCHCKLWEEWMLKISDVKSEEMKQTYSRTEDAANCLWLMRHSKQCPQCKTHIQKSDGCNHMKCGKCRHDFCWVCLEPWKKHNSATGGYFRCNRSEAVQKTEENAFLMKKVAEAQHFEMQELKKFVHHYTKFKFNESAYKGELPLIESSKQKQLELYQCLQKYYKQSIERNDQFLYESALELIRSRRILCGSAVYGYYLEDHGYNKTIFDYMENDLNCACNRLSEIISSHYLKTSRLKIIEFTNKIKNKRLEFLRAVSHGLIPPETPPGLKSHRHFYRRRRRFPGVLGLDKLDDDIYNDDVCDDDEQITRAIIASIEDLDPSNPWVCDSSGRHSNLPAIYDWPDHYDDDDDDDHQHCNGNRNNEPKINIKSEPKITNNLLGECSRDTCNKSRVRNPRTGEIHQYCSLKCKQLDQLKFSDTMEQIAYAYDDPSIELQLALEMSKISMIEDEERRSRCRDVTSDNYLAIDSNDVNRKLNCNSEGCTNVDAIIMKLKCDDVPPAAKNAIFFFLKSSETDCIIKKNLNNSIPDSKSEKELFTPMYDQLK